MNSNFVPSRNPALSVIVVIDSARTGQGYGGARLAPRFRQVVQSRPGERPAADHGVAVMPVRRRDGARLRRVRDGQQELLLGELGVPALFVLTKADKLKALERENRELRRAMVMAISRVASIFGPCIVPSVAMSV